MHVSSLGFRTDLALLADSGSVVEDRGTHLVVRSPENPSYFWGNFLLLAEPPVPGGEKEVVGAFLKILRSTIAEGRVGVPA